MKFLNLVLIIVGIILLFNMAGIETTTGSIVKSFLTDGISAFKDSLLWTNLKLVLAGTLITGAVASFFGRSPDISWALATFTTFFGGAVIADMIGLYNTITTYGSQWMNNLFLVIFSLLMVGFIVSLISFWRGSDG